MGNEGDMWGWRGHGGTGGDTWEWVGQGGKGRDMEGQEGTWGTK